MKITPSLKEYLQLAKRYNVIPISAEVVVDRATPVSIYERLAAGEDYAFLLESVEGGERFGRYSFIGRRPHTVLICRGRTLTLREGKVQRTWETRDPVEEMKTIFARYKTAPLPHMPRFWGGAVGYWDYDTVRFFEQLPDNLPDSQGVPSGMFQWTQDVVILDRFSQTARILSTVIVPKGLTNVKALTALYRRAEVAITEQRKVIENPSFRSAKAPVSAFRSPKALTRQSDYLDAVKRAQEYIRAGDIIQVVLSQRWEITPGTTPFQVYRALRIVNPSPYMYLLHFPEMDLVGSSPELLVRKEGDVAETRPIAGTRPRGSTVEEDEALAKALLEDPKERAEHLMLVDLGRNDLGRVCVPGSVRVPEFMQVENFSHVMHIVSSVTGRLSTSANAFDLFRACFPAGTVSGAPKIRAMEIIDELEKLRRGPYAGAVGYFSYSGNMDMAITIRTLVFKGKKAYLQAGAGIVADSVPLTEYVECKHKAAALLAALEKTRELS